MTAPKSPQSAAADHANSFAVGDQVHYSGAVLGDLRGEVAKVLELSDASGHRLKTFLVRIVGAVEQIHTSADALTKVDRKPVPASIEIPRSAYTDTMVEPVVDDREGVEPGSTDDGFEGSDEPLTEAELAKFKAEFWHGIPQAERERMVG